MTNYPHAVLQKSDRELAILWNDGKEQVIDVVDLRRKCPCAACVDELSGERILLPEDISEAVRPRSVKSIGQYAINLEFSDGHKTGFYTFEKLRNYLETEN